MKNLMQFIELMPVDVFKKMTTFETKDGGEYSYFSDNDSMSNRMDFFAFLLSKKENIKDWD